MYRQEYLELPHSSAHSFAPSRPLRHFPSLLPQNTSPSTTETSYSWCRCGSDRAAIQRCGLPPLGEEFTVTVTVSTTESANRAGFRDSCMEL